jgi:hypothetical protein
MSSSWPSSVHRTRSLSALGSRAASGARADRSPSARSATSASGSTAETSGLPRLRTSTSRRRRRTSTCRASRFCAGRPRTSPQEGPLARAGRRLRPDGAGPRSRAGRACPRPRDPPLLSRWTVRFLRGAASPAVLRLIPPPACHALTARPPKPLELVLGQRPAGPHRNATPHRSRHSGRRPLLRQRHRGEVFRMVFANGVHRRARHPTFWRRMPANP